jgi:hypothetical protein
MIDAKVGVEKGRGLALRHAGEAVGVMIAVTLHVGNADQRRRSRCRAG